MDLSLLAEILQLPQKPTLRPARIISYERKAWGQYPALVDSAMGTELEGAVYEVATIREQATLHAGIDLYSEL